MAIVDAACSFVGWGAIVLLLIMAAADIDYRRERKRREKIREELERDSRSTK